ncbi:MAG: hypothetical protein Q7Q71_12830 [Verrucomicrobiota bacterium JB023]|nr:hypothetical protein [Verrucomicrobiota bacterium JB023]
MNNTYPQTTNGPSLAEPSQIEPDTPPVLNEYTEHTHQEEAQEGLNELKQQSKEAATHVKDVAVTRAKDVAGQTGQAVKNKADKTVDLAGNKVRNLSKALHDASDRLQEEQPEKTVSGTRYLAKKVGCVADYFESKDSQELTDDFRQVVRNHPVATVGALAAVGLAAGRFLKATTPAAEIQQGHA